MNKSTGSHKVSQDKMKVTQSSRSFSNLAMLVVCIGALLFTLFITTIAYPDSRGWPIGAFLIVMFFLGGLGVSKRLIWPVELCFEIRTGEITITDLKRSGNGYRTMTFPQAEVVRVHFANSAEHDSFIETVSGKRKVLVGEIFESWPAIKRLLAHKAPEIAVTEGQCERDCRKRPLGSDGLSR